MDNNTDMRSSIKLMIGGLVAIIVAGVILAIAMKKFIAPVLQEGYEEGNIVLLGIVMIVLFSFLIKFALGYCMTAMRIFLLLFVSSGACTISPVDTLLPIKSDFTLKDEYFYLVTVRFLEDAEGIKESTPLLCRLFIKVLPYLNIIYSVLFNLILIVGGIFLAVKYGMYYPMSQHIMWFMVLVVLMLLNIGVRTVMFGIMCLSLDEYITSYNPIYMVIVPMVLPFVLLVNITLIIISYIHGSMLVQLPILNLLSFVLLPVVNIFISLLNVRKTVLEVKTNVDENRRKEGLRPFPW